MRPTAARRAPRPARRPSLRLCLEKMPDRLFEHPATVPVVTNMHYSEAPSLQPRSMQAAATLNWIETPLAGNTSHEFHEQIAALQPTLAETWRVRPSPKTGNPLYGWEAGASSIRGRVRTGQ